MNALGLAETIRILREKGYVEDFSFSEGTLDPQTGNLRVIDDEFMIDQTFRFDVMSDPDDQSILYAIHSIKTGKKGVLVNGFGIYSEAKTNQIVARLLKPEKSSQGSIK